MLFIKGFCVHSVTFFDLQHLRKKKRGAGGECNERTLVVKLFEVSISVCDWGKVRVRSARRTH